MKESGKKRYYRDDALLLKMGARIRALRQDKGMTQMDLAFKCNEMDYSQINRMELGKVNFNICLFSLVAKALEVDPCVFFMKDE